MTVVEDTLPLAVLDFVGIEHGESPSAAIAGAVSIARAVEAAGYRRYWVSEHHNMTSLACTAPELLTAHAGAYTSRIRVGAAGIMLPNHAPFKVAETFRTLLGDVSRADRSGARSGAGDRPVDRARAAAGGGRRSGGGVPRAGR